MGIVNATPDSFSDGGAFADAEAAVAHGLGLVAAGADIVDVGGESTRPGAASVSATEEVARALPVIEGLVAAGAVVSIDTTKAEVAHAAIVAGAEIVNDVNGLRSPGMLDVCVSSGAGVVIVHMLGRPRTMQAKPEYDDVVVEVGAFLRERAGTATGAGIDPDRICIDPGIGFGKTLDHNLALLSNLALLVDEGFPVLVGTSRKSFLGTILERGGVRPSANERGAATVATVALAIASGAAVVRVHDVAPAVDAARVADAILRGS